MKTMTENTIDAVSLPLYDSRDTYQMTLWMDEPVSENPDYLCRQLITYIGNKRALLVHIGKAVAQVKKRLGKEKLRVFDAFSGSGIVSRFFKSHASTVISNDIEDYASTISHCFLQNKSEIDVRLLSEIVRDLNSKVLSQKFSTGFIEELYSPKDETNINREDRVFYTKQNARRLDNYCRLLNDFPNEVRTLLLGPLLSKASVHSNTAGVFKGFYKNRHTKIGQFGGTGSDALTRILGIIELEVPVLSNFDCQYEVFQEDANVVAGRLKNLDIAYLDPPYNQHPYGSNYFMLNLIVRYERPTHISQVSGIPIDWRRSDYNVRAKALPKLRSLLEALDAPFLLISFNNEGFVSPEAMYSLLKTLGNVERFEIPYNAFRGARNFNNRSIHVTEQLFLVERR